MTKETTEPATGRDAPAGAPGDEDAVTPRRPPMLVEQLGGWRGMVDSALPVAVFVVANTLGGLTVAVWSACGAGALVAAVRMVRRESVQQAFSGLLGVALAAYIAHRTGTAKGYFLLGIWASFGYAAVFLASVLVRWPLIGVIWEYVEGDGTAWRQHRGLRRVYTWTTVLWGAVFLARALVQHVLYDTNRTGWLAVARLGMGYPVTLGALGATLLAVRRVRRQANNAVPA
ncbi:MAG: DUF3159 domain-containing protein [Actinobacteria bacterium]|nr:DUF3159 domain-containing protein [Actinomycetota bacterium]